VAAAGPRGRRLRRPGLASAFSRGRPVTFSPAARRFGGGTVPGLESPSRWVRRRVRDVRFGDLAASSSDPSTFSVCILSRLTSRLVDGRRISCWLSKPAC